MKTALLTGLFMASLACHPGVAAESPTADTSSPKAPRNAPPSDYEFVSFEIKTTRDETIKKDFVFLVMEFKNSLDKDVSALRGTVNIYDSTGTVVYMTGVTQDNGANLLYKAGQPLKVSIGYLESATLSAGKMSGKPLLETLRGNPREYGASLKVSHLKFTDKTEKNFP